MCRNIFFSMGSQSALQPWIFQAGHRKRHISTRKGSCDYGHVRFCAVKWRQVRMKQAEKKRGKSVCSDRTDHPSAARTSSCNMRCWCEIWCRTTFVLALIWTENWAWDNSTIYTTKSVVRWQKIKTHRSWCEHTVEHHCVWFYLQQVALLR